MNKDYPAKYESRFTLTDGREVFLRPILQTDERLIVDLLNKLSPDSVYLRFLRPVTELPPELLHQLTHINYTSNFALAALAREAGRDVLVAVARYGSDSESGCTDLAIAVRDDWQKCGLGRTMLARILAIGAGHGITRFESVMDSTNRAMKHLLSKLDYTVNYDYRGGAAQVEIQTQKRK